MNVDTGEFQALSDQAARAGEYRRGEKLLTLTLASEIEGGSGPLSSDDVVRRLSDAVIEQHRVIAELRTLIGIPARAVRGRHLHLVK